MEYALLIFSVLFGALRNIFAKVVKKEKETFYEVLKTNVITFVFAFVAVFFIGISNIKTIFYVPWGLVLIYAVCTLGSQLTLVKSVELGSVSLSTLFYSCGFIIPTLFGSIRYKEEINALHIVGLMLIIVSFACSVKKEEGKKFNIGWLIAAIGGLFFAGMVGVVQKIFTNEYLSYNLDNFMSVTFMIMVAASMLLWLSFGVCRQKLIE